MANDIIDAGSSTADVQVDLGGGQRASMQAVQHIYNQITGRSEQLTRLYTINHSTGFDDLGQLNAKICQLYEQYNIVSQNCSITLLHVDDQKQTFSSFERSTTGQMQITYIDYTVARNFQLAIDG